VANTSTLHAIHLRHFLLELLATGAKPTLFVFQNAGSSLATTTSDQLSTLLLWVRTAPALTAGQIKKFIITQPDLQSALKSVQPSAKREGFATVPDVTWDDVGSLVKIREDLKMTILVSILVTFTNI